MNAANDAKVATVKHKRAALVSLQAQLPQHIHSTPHVPNTKQTRYVSDPVEAL
jgi:hypothetical protein